LGPFEFYLQKFQEDSPLPCPYNCNCSGVCDYSNGSSCVFESEFTDGRSDVIMDGPGFPSPTSEAEGSTTVVLPVLIVVFLCGVLCATILFKLWRRRFNQATTSASSNPQYVMVPLESYSNFVASQPQAPQPVAIQTPSSTIDGQGITFFPAYTTRGSGSNRLL